MIAAEFGRPGRNIEAFRIGDDRALGGDGGRNSQGRGQRGQN